MAIIDQGFPGFEFFISWRNTIACMYHDKFMSFFALSSHQHFIHRTSYGSLVSQV